MLSALVFDSILRLRRSTSKSESKIYNLYCRTYPFLQLHQGFSLPHHNIL